MAHLERELTFISARLLELIADGSVGAAAAAAIASGVDRADALAAGLKEYIRSCDALGVEHIALPFGFAQRLAQELKASPAARGGVASGLLAGGATARASAASLEGGYSVRLSGVTTTFSGAIRLLGGGRDLAGGGGQLRPLSTVAALRLQGVEGLNQPLAAVVRAAQSRADAAVRSLLSGGGAAHPSPAVPGRGSAATSAAAGEAELVRAHEQLKLLEAGVLDVADGEALLARLARQPPPTVDALRRTKAGVTVRRLKSHSHHSVAALASAVFEAWRAAADSEERFLKRAVSRRDPRLDCPPSPRARDVTSPKRASADCLAWRLQASLQPSARVEGSGLTAAPTEPIRQTAFVLIAEALRVSASGAPAGRATPAGKHTGSDAAIAVSLEAAVYAEQGGTGKAYKSRCRALASQLKSERASGLRKRLRDGELSGEGLCKLDLAEELLSSEERRKRQDRREKEARAIDSVRSANQGDNTGAYRCIECGCTHVSLFGTNSMGTPGMEDKVPDMIVQCNECNHRFAVGS